jgi:hypothetical protein
VTGTITGNNGFDAEYNAWVFDGSGDYIQKTSINSQSGNWIHSISTWIYFNDLVTGKVFSIDPPSYLYGGHNETSAFFARSTGFIWDFGMQNNNTTTLVPQKNRWYHVTLVADGTGYKKIYIDNNLQSSFSYSNNTNINMQTGATLNIGEGNLNGKIANFRLYSKVLNAEQIRELYEYDAPRFGHRQNLVSLHKGNLGVGVAHPTSRFEVAGVDGLQEYPPKAMTDYETYIEGHGVFKASASNFYAGSHFPFEAFDKDVSDINKRWRTSDDQYSSNVAIAGHTLGTDVPNGVWLKLNCPYAVNVSSFTIYPVSSQEPEEIQLWGSNNDGDWTHLSTHSCPKSTSAATYTLKHINYYTYIAYVITKNYGTEAGLYDISYYGTPAPSALEDGHMTLGKALTLPRVSGHPAGAETPRAESLVVHYDTTVDSVVSGTTVVDISGEGANGTLTNGAAYSSTDRALTFDRVNDYLTGSITASGNFVHSISMWFKPTVVDSSVQMLFFMSSNGGTDLGRSIIFFDSASGIGFDFRSKGIRYLVPPVANQWMHLVCTYDGNLDGSGSNDMKIYINGVKATNTAVSGASSTLNLINGTFWIGNTTGSSQHFGGSISNFKLWDVALTAEEVAAEYALGRTGKSINLTDTALCLGGTVPRAQLDVRGGARFDGHMGIGNQPTNADDGNAYPDTFPASSLHIHQATAVSGNDETQGIRFSHPLNVGRWNLFISDNNHFRFAYNGIGIGYVDQTDPNAQMNFTGQHRTFIKDIPFTRAEDLEGLIVSADNNKYIKMSGGIEVGSNAITTNESLPVVSLSTIVNDKKCFGVISGSEDPETRQEQYGNFVSVNKKEVGDTRVYINSVGEGAMWVTDINGPLESGDYITTSNVAGYGQKQDSEFLANYTVAKITMDCDFDPQDQPIQRIKQSNVVETHYMGVVSVTRGVPHEFVTTTVTANDEWSNVSISPSDVTYAEWSNLEANVQNTYTLTYTQTSNVVYDVKYTKTTTANVTQSDPWDNVYVDPPNVSYEEWSNLEANVQNTYTLTYTMTTKVEATEAIYSNLSTEDKELFVPTYYQMVEQRVDAEYPGAVKHETVTDRLENALDEHGQLQWEDDPSGATEKAYKIRYLDVSGQITDEANAVHTAAFVGVTYHCG